MVGGGFLGRRLRRCRWVRRLMVAGTRRGWKGRGMYLGNSGFGDRRGMRERMDRDLALGIGGFVEELGSGWELWEVRRLGGGLLVGVVVVGHRWMGRGFVVVLVIGLVVL